MDNSKVNGLNVPTHTTSARPTRADEAAMNRFSWAMRESPRSYSTAIADAPRANGREAIKGTAISDITRESQQDNEAYRRLRGPLPGGVMEAVVRDAAADPANDNPQPATTRATGGELTQMLERMCSALYIGEKSVASQRVVMALDHVLPGAAAEIVREGAHLSIRLHARTAASYRSMSSQRDALIRALNGDGNWRVDVSVVHGNDEKAFGDGHG